MKRFLAFIFLIIFIVIAPVALVAHSLKSTLLDPDVVKQQLLETNAYQRSIDIALEEVRTTPELFGQEIPFFSQEEITDSLRELITPAWLRKQVEHIVDQLWGWLGSSQDIRSVSVVLSFGEITQRFTSILTTKIDQRLASLPVCTQDQLLTQVSQTDLIERGVCVPSGVTASSLVRENDLNDVINLIPDEIDVIELITSQQGQEVQTTLNELNAYRDRLAQALEALQTLFVILLMVLLLIAALTMSTAKSLFGWVGVPLLIVGGVVIIGPIMLLERASDMLSATLGSAGISANGQGLIQELQEGMLAVFVGKLRTLGILLGSTGFVFLLLSLVLPRKKDQKSKKDGTDITPSVSKLTLQEKFRR